MFHAETIEGCRKKRDEILAEYSDVAPEAMKCLDEGFESAMTVMVFPKSLRRFFRTSNHIERLNKELKRRSKVIGVFPNEQSLIRLIGAVLIEQNSVYQSGRAVFGKDGYQKFLESDIRNCLHQIAEEQKNLLAA